MHISGRTRSRAPRWRAARITSRMRRSLPTQSPTVWLIDAAETWAASRVRGMPAIYLAALPGAAADLDRPGRPGDHQVQRQLDRHPAGACDGGEVVQAAEQRQDPDHQGEGHGVAGGEP